MKKFIGVTILMLLCSLSVAAQTPPGGTVPSVTLTCTPPSPVGGTGTVGGYNFYKSIAGASYVKINTAILPTCGTTDTNVTQGQALSYVATTVDSASHESASSVAATTTVPTNPNPPTLTITSVALIPNGNTETIVAKWTDTNLGVGQAFFFTNSSKFLGQGLTSSPSGIFAEEITIPTGTAVTFMVCNTAGICANQQAM